MTLLDPLYAIRGSDFNGLLGDARCYFEISQDNSTYALGVPAEFRHVATTMISVCGKPTEQGRLKLGGIGGIVNKLGKYVPILTGAFHRI